MRGRAVLASEQGVSLAPLACHLPVTLGSSLRMPCRGHVSCMPLPCVRPPAAPRSHSTDLHPRQQSRRLLPRRWPGAAALGACCGGPDPAPRPAPCASPRRAVLCLHSCLPRPPAGRPEVAVCARQRQAAGVPGHGAGVRGGEAGGCGGHVHAGEQLCTQRMRVCVFVGRGVRMGVGARHRGCTASSWRRRHHRVQMGGSVFDLEEAELCYAPQYGSAKDVVNFAGMVAANVRACGCLTAAAAAAAAAAVSAGMRLLAG